MEGIPIRHARRGDIPSLLLLWHAMMKESLEGDPRFALHPGARAHMAAAFAAWLQEPQRTMLVAEEGGRLVVGFATAVVLPGNGWQVPERLGRIADLYVAPARRRQGIARRLAGRLLDLLYEEGVETVRLAAATENAGARAFWHAVGWSELEVVLERPVPGLPPSPEDESSAV